MSLILNKYDFQITDCIKIKRRHWICFYSSKFLLIFIYWNRDARAAFESWIFLGRYVFEKVFRLKNFWCNDREFVLDVAWSVAVADKCPVVNALIWLVARKIIRMIFKKFIFMIFNGMIWIFVNIFQKISLAPPEGRVTVLRQYYSHNSAQRLEIAPQRVAYLL